MKSDIEIARETKLVPISQIADNLGIPAEKSELYGHYVSKISESLIDLEKVRQHKLVLVTAITPTKAGIGKTTVSVGLSLGLNRIGKKAIVALREPSLGPCFGMKGGAAGGGYAQVLPMDKINLHFTGDFHAVTTAHNMIAALLDNYIYQHRKDGFAMREILWNRVLDINDRNLRHVVTGLGGKTDGITMKSGFDITPASEIMAILCLSTSLEDLHRRIGNVLIGTTIDGKPFRVNDLGVTGSICALLKDALHPNLVQTTENTPAFVHGGPFANIAHGCNSVLATRLALTYGDYVVSEAGFGADLGAEKFFDIKCRKSGLQPALSVLVASTQGLKMHGGVPLSDIKNPNMEGLKEGFKNLDKHVKNLQRFGQTVIVCFNRFSSDSDEEIRVCREHCAELGIGFAVCDAFNDGGMGAVELAELVVKTIEEHPSQPLHYCYEDDATIEEKARAVACGIYGADDVTFSSSAKAMIEKINEMGISHYPICIAKTQFSFSADQKAYGVPVGFKINVRDIVINCGAETIVLIAGDVMRMPGLPLSPQAERINLVDGEIVGLS